LETQKWKWSQGWFGRGVQELLNVLFAMQWNRTLEMDTLNKQWKRVSQTSSEQRAVSKNEQ